MWERIDAEQKHYSVLAEEPFQNFARNFNGDYFETIKTIDPVTRQAMISHTLLIDDDIINVSIAQRSGYMAYQVPVTGLTIEDWNRITRSIEQRKNCPCLFYQKIQNLR